MQGLLLVDKPQKYTSFDVVAKLRKITGQRRIGHTGTLDPMATGVLPVLLGRATRFVDLLANTDKAYRVQMRFGIQTDTLDIWGKKIKEEPTFIQKEEILPVLSGFTGRIQQIPPMFSAVKKGGKKLYEYARDGMEIERPARTVWIYGIQMIAFEGTTQTLSLDVFCSKGTYIRSLCADIGERLGSCAVMTQLTRTMACGFSLEECLPLLKLEQEGAQPYLRPPEDALKGYPSVQVTEAQARRFANGGALSFERVTLSVPSPFYLVYHKEEFVGVARRDEQRAQLGVQCLLTGGPGG